MRGDMLICARAMILVVLSAANGIKVGNEICWYLSWVTKQPLIPWGGEGYAKHT